MICRHPSRDPPILLFPHGPSTQPYDACPSQSQTRRYRQGSDADRGAQTQFLVNMHYRWWLEPGLLIVSCCAGRQTHPGIDIDLGSYFTRHRHRRMSAFGALRSRCQFGRLHQHPSSDMPCLQVPLQRSKTQAVRQRRLEHESHRPLRLDGGQ